MIKKSRGQCFTNRFDACSMAMLARWPTILFAMVLLLCACAGVPSETRREVSKASESRPVTPGVDDQIKVRTMSVHLPSSPGWSKREVPMPNGGMLFVFERDIPTGNRVQIHVADYFGQSMVLPMELAMSGHNDTERLGMFILLTESAVRSEIRRQSEWVKILREPQRSFNAACLEKHEVREERAEDGNLYLWQNWMFFCVDPVSHIPIQIDYAERYLAEGGTPSPTFTEDAASFFDSIQFYGADMSTRPVAEVTAAFVQANNNLFSNIDFNDYPAAVVFSLDPNVKYSMLLNLAHRLFMLKGTSPKDPSENAIAKYLTDERCYPTRFFMVPESISHSDEVFMGDLLIHRSLLPKGHIGKGSGYGEFLFRIRVYPASEHHYLLEHVGIQWLK